MLASEDGQFEVTEHAVSAGSKPKLACTRRTLLASAAAFAALGSKTSFAATPAKPPVARASDFSEIIHGVRIADPYRWMEDSRSPEWGVFVQGQAAYARTTLDAIPGRAALLKRISELSADSTMANQVMVVGNRIITLARPQGAENLMLLVRNGIDGEERILVDPQKLAPPGKHGAIDYYWQPSPDGRYVVFGFSYGGLEDTTQRVVEVATGRLLPDAIDRTNFGQPSWAPDSSGFYYNRLVRPANSGPDAYKNSSLWFHRLGDDVSKDTRIISAGLDPSVPVGEDDFPDLEAYAGSDYLLGSVATGVETELTYYVATSASTQAGKPQWTRVCTKADGVIAAVMWHNDIYMMTKEGAPRLRIVKTSAAAPDMATAIEVLPQQEGVLLEMSPARDALYITIRDGSVHRLLAVMPNGAVRKITLPFEGAIPWGFYTHPLQNGGWFAMQSWVQPQTVGQLHADDSVRLTDIAKKPKVDVSSYAFTQVRVRARDGVEIPLSLIHHKDAPKNGPVPLIMTVYGCYGVILEPRFTPTDMAWLELGGALAVAHVRGGGEFGDAWHNAGRKQTKPNTWRDLIDCSKWLIANRWTDAKRLAIQGKSGGGIAVGRAMTEAPELFGSVISRVGVTNALRFHVMPSGAANVPEFGSIGDPEGFRALFEMDSYHHVRSGVDYPPVLLTTGMEDTRVSPWQVGKMAARLQAVSREPVLMRVEAEAGHGLGATRRQEDEERADIFAFVLWNAGVPEFQPAHS